VASAHAAFAQSERRAVLERSDVAVREGLAAIAKGRRAAATGRAGCVGEGAREIERG
jgi:hypothetical protein